MTKAPVFPLAIKIVLGSAEFNPFLASGENCPVLMSAARL
jgi:hypothetical protein